jgi:HD-like signal output (HDOD) protein
MNQTPTATTQPLTDSVRRVVDSGKIALPPLPNLVNRLMELLRDQDGASSKKVAQLVGTDPAVAATLLKWANSAAFGGLNPVSDLSLAIARLGFRQVTSAVTTLAHSGHFRSDDPLKSRLLESLWGHAVTTAMASKQIAGLIGGEPEQSFVAGLLHDTGKLLVLRAVDYLETHGGTDITPPVMDELMTVLHTELGHRTLASWSLPEPICYSALHHHDEEIDPDHPLAVRVQAADAVACKLGFHLKPDPELDLISLPSVDYLNLSDIEMASMMVDLEDQVAEVRKLF